VASLLEAVRLAPDYVEARINLAQGLAALGKIDEAIDHGRKAVASAPDSPKAHFALAYALSSFERPELEAATAALVRAIELDPAYADAHNNLGSVLQRRNDLPGAIAHLRRSLELNPEQLNAYRNLGNALSASGEAEGAVSAFTEALRRQPDDATTWYRLGFQLRKLGRLAESLDALRRSRIAEEVRIGERLLALEPQLAELLAGTLEASTARERADHARLCTSKGHYATAVRLYEDAFGRDPTLADDLYEQPRHNAAQAAALAGVGRGLDAEALDEGARRALRARALAWLRDDLSACEVELATDPRQTRMWLRSWELDPDFAGLRDPTSVSMLPAEESEAWRALWRDGSALQARASEALLTGRPK
jgi:tetratricopeptide (TPR) repeat protein